MRDGGGSRWNKVEREDKSRAGAWGYLSSGFERGYVSSTMRGGWISKKMERANE